MSEFKCPECGRYKKPDPKSFKNGDRVSFVMRRSSGNRVSMKSVNGEIVECNNENVVVMSKKKQYGVARTGLTYQGQPSPLTYQLFGVCVCVEPEPKV